MCVDTASMTIVYAPVCVCVKLLAIAVSGNVSRERTGAGVHSASPRFALASGQGFFPGQ
jgi:hypothetical protein